MKIFNVEEFNEGNVQDVYCLFCGTRVGYDNNGDNFQDCEHVRLICTNETWDNPELNKDDFFKDFNDEEDFEFDHLDKTLNDDYLMIRTRTGGPSLLEVYFLFNQFPHN